MRRTTAVLALLSSGLVVIGCSPSTEVAATEATPATPTVWAGAPDPESTTLHQYIVDNKLPEVSFKPGDQGTPDISFAMPPGWGLAGDRTPEWAYGAIVYGKAKNPDDPPYMVAIASKLPADVDPATILDYAPGQLNNLPDFAPFHTPKLDSVSGFKAIDYTGTYVRQGQPRVIGQQTIVVPGKDALFVLQLNADAPRGEEQPVLDAAKVIDEKTVITLPS